MPTQLPDGNLILNVGDAIYGRILSSAGSMPPDSPTFALEDKSTQARWHQTRQNTPAPLEKRRAKTCGRDASLPHCTSYFVRSRNPVSAILDPRPIFSKP